MRCKFLSWLIIAGFIVWMVDFVIQALNGNVTAELGISTFAISLITALHIVESMLHSRNKIQSNVLYFMIGGCYPVFIFIYYYVLR